jgi:hypothetical protein
MGSGWSEPAATSVPVQDKAVQAVLWMNQKHNLFPCPGIFQPPSLPQNFPLLPPSPHFLFTPSPKLGELPSLVAQSFKEMWDTRLEEGGELNIEGAWREGKRSAASQT